MDKDGDDTLTMAMAEYRFGHFERAAVLLDGLCGANEPLAFLLLGDMHLAGQGMAQDSERGVALIRRAAELQHTLAMLRLADLYMRGEHLERDTNQAKQWLLLAHHCGDPKAAALYGHWQETYPDLDFSF